MLLGIVTLVFVMLYFGFVMWMISKWNNISVPPIKKETVDDSSRFISVIIPFKDEESTIAEVISSVLTQTHRNFEIIAVNDGSVDQSLEIATELIGTPHKIISTVHSNGKKSALNQGIAQAKGEIIVTLDADTLVERDWLRHIDACFSKEETGLVVLPVDFRRSSWLKSFFELEFLSLVGSGIACAQGVRALMANGANLAFRRQAFKDVGGYSSHNLYSSGDDQFLLFDIHKSEKWQIQTYFSLPLIAHTEPPKNWKAWFNQRIRWGSKASAPSTIFATGVSWLVFLTCLLMTLSALGSMIWSSLVSWTLVAFFLKGMADAAFLLLVSSRFKKTFLMLTFPLLALVYPFLLTTSALLSLSVRPQWKGRKISVGKEPTSQR